MYDLISKKDVLKKINLATETCSSREQEGLDAAYALIRDIEPLEINTDALDRYADLCNYFNVAQNETCSTLNNQKEFIAWLDRMKWHVVECDKLSRQINKLLKSYDDIKQAVCDYKYSSDQLNSEFSKGYSFACRMIIDTIDRIAKDYKPFIPQEDYSD